MTNKNETVDEQRWERLLLMLKERFGKEPNMEAILFLIGINEYHGCMPMHRFSKEQKQDLMHVAVCTLLCEEGFFKLESYDEEGWPHFMQLKANTPADLAGQEDLLREKILGYFDY